MYVFAVGMERCGTHSVTNILDKACTVSHHVVHEEAPYLCEEAKLLFEEKDYRTQNLKNKFSRWRALHKNNKLVCEANHRLGYLILPIAREFKDSKFIFLYRDPIATLISRISIWAYYPEYVHMYPEFYIEKLNSLSDKSKEFNKFRISPPKHVPCKSLIDVYLWEWLENYKFVRMQLACIPEKNRLLMSTGNITKEFSRLFQFVGNQYFQINDEVMGWSMVKSDSIYPQHKIKETDNFVTNSRDPKEDVFITYAKNMVKSNFDLISQKIFTELEKLPFLESDLLHMDKEISNTLKVKML